jgi:hypothetical protein
MEINTVQHAPFLLRAVQQLMTLLHRVLIGCIRAPNASRLSARLCISRKAVKWLACKAFLHVLRRKPTRYRLLLASLEELIKQDGRKVSQDVKRTASDAANAPFAHIR